MAEPSPSPTAWTTSATASPTLPQAAGRAPRPSRWSPYPKRTRPQPLAEAIAAGQLCFGENRVQEAETKFPPLRPTTPGLQLHLIGPLQTNKVRDAMRVADVIETLDRPRLADALAAAHGQG